MNKLLLLFLTITLLSCNQSETEEEGDEAPIHYGIYQTKLITGKTESEKYRYFLRFYEDGTVISMTSGGTADDVKKWFKKNHESVATGQYKIKGDKISFTTSSSYGENKYTGTLQDKETLQLNVSSDNNEEGTEHTFSFADADSE
jgi:hypothetical protein